ncbi:hypothetical protein ACFUTR_23615 [Streptomyces sp. NPDC057367]|uniref:hypothetical protein n=1 Tax=Streptomyces sp. NPDC057367 TaxID=3346108 RepID=UPI00363DAD59
MSTNPQLSFTPRSDWLAGYLRGDQIRTDTLVQLVQHWADLDARDAVIEALDALAVVVQGAAREGELDAAVETVEDEASMDTARIEVDAFTVRRLATELEPLAGKLSRFNPQGIVPAPREGRWTA